MKKGNKNKQRINRNRSREDGTISMTYRVPRSQEIVPPSMISNLVFVDDAHNPLTNAGLTYASFRLRPSSAFDVDPAVGGSSMIGFNELAAIYGKYRVLSSSLEVQVDNKELFPVHVCAFATNFDLGNNYAGVQSYFGNSVAKWRHLSAIGGQDRGKIILPNITSEMIAGTRTANFDDDYASAVTTSPVNNWYWNIGLWTGNATVLNNGIGILTVVRSRVLFSERIHLVV
jgi:hypothetical protein